MICPVKVVAIDFNRQKRALFIHRGMAVRVKRPYLFPCSSYD